MNSLPLIIAVFVMFPAVAAMLWALRTTQRAENDLRIDAGLEESDFDIGTWPSSKRAAAT